MKRLIRTIKISLPWGKKADQPVAAALQRDLSMSTEFQQYFGIDLVADLQVDGASGVPGQVLQSQGPGSPPVWTTVAGVVVDKLVSGSVDSSGLMTLVSADGSSVLVQLPALPEPDEIVSASVSPLGMLTLVKSSGGTVEVQLAVASSSTIRAFKYDSLAMGIGAATLHTVQHNLGEVHPSLSVYRVDGSNPNSVVQPAFVRALSASTLEIGFPVAVACVAVLVAP